MFPLFLPFFYTPSYYRLFDVWLFLRLAQINGAFGLREPEKIRENGTQRNVISPPYIILANTHSHTHCYSPKQVVESKWEQSDALMEAMSRGKGGGPERERCKKMKHEEHESAEKGDEVIYLHVAKERFLLGWILCCLLSLSRHSPLISFLFSYQQVFHFSPPSFHFLPSLAYVAA